MRPGQITSSPLIKQIRFHKHKLEQQQFRLTLALADGDQDKADNLRRQMAIKTNHLRHLRGALNAS